DPQRVDVVQRLELAFAVPPAMGQGFEFGDFGVVDVAHVQILEKLEKSCSPEPWLKGCYSSRPLMRRPQAWAVAVSCDSSRRVSRPSSSNGLPATHRCFTQSRPVA